VNGDGGGSPRIPANMEEFLSMERAPLAGGRMVENIAYFARTLRRAGLPIGPGKILTALRAVETVGLGNRDDFYWALHSVFVNRRDQKELFDQAFHIFWRNPRFLDRMMSLLLPDSPMLDSGDMSKDNEVSRRVAEAMNLIPPEREGDEPEQEQTEIDAVMTFSDKEVLQSIDFEKMSAEELELAKQAIKRMHLPLRDLPTRRFRPNPRGRRADLRATMRSALRSGGDMIPLRWKSRRRQSPPLVVICDISGSMSRYSRMLLHFMHAVTNDRDRVFTFLFGTRLTHVTRYLRSKDVDVALEKVSEEVVDWSGGTRIGACLHDFNRYWTRRVLGQGALVLLISDGLDRDNADGLAAEVDRLKRSCRRLIWLNPLLRYDQYEPKSLGAQAILPHVDELRSVHNLESLSQLSEALSQSAVSGHEARFAA